MIRFWALLALLGCVSPGAVSCPDGVVCPEGLECATVATVPYCVDKSQLGCADGEACAVGTCHEGVCLPNECGNSLVDLGEVCDDGNTTDDDMCSATCTSTNVCGNGIVDPVKAEQCDTGVAGMSGDGCASTCSVEALIWRDVTPRGVGARTGSVIAYDSKRGRAMLFGGRSAQAIHDDTWQYVTSTWIRRGTGRSAPGRSNAAMVYDVARDQLVLFGGFGGDFLGDTWTFDGGTWTQRVTATSPSARLSPAMAYHAARGETLLFGGQKATALGDSWVWNGAAWSELTSGVSPQPYGNPVMAYDPIRMEILYHGGANETWTWNGSWTLKSPTTVPAQVIYDGLAYSSTFDEMVMFSAQATYTWNGSDWQLRSTTTSPTAREGIAMSYAGPGGTILFGGNDQMFSPQTLYQETWGWSGADWSVVPQNPTTPPARQGHAMTYDARHGEIIMFGGGTNSGVLFGDTWRWSDASWSVAPGTGALQLARAYAALAYDSVRDRVVLFGGTDEADYFTTGTAFGDTWEWDGDAGNWEVRATTGPPPRRYASMAFDADAAQIVMFGGSNGSLAPKNDTWTWNGSTWTERTPAIAPPARDGAGMTYDPVRKRIVMFGGASQVPSMALADTWEWDGTAWTERIPTTSPPGRSSATLVYDPGRQTVVLAAGRGPTGFRDDVWEWNGSTWTQLLPQGNPGPVITMAYDNIEHRLIAYGDADFLGVSDDTWALELTTPLATREPCLVGTDDDDGDGRAGCADPDCWGRCTPTCPPLTTCPASAPQCGDGDCAPVESHAMCPTDCV